MILAFMAFCALFVLDCAVKKALTKTLGSVYFFYMIFDGIGFYIHSFLVNIFTSLHDWRVSLHYKKVMHCDTERVVHAKFNGLLHLGENRPLNGQAPRTLLVCRVWEWQFS